MKPDRHVEHVEIGGADHGAGRHHRFGRRHCVLWEWHDVVAAPLHFRGIDFHRGGQHLLQCLVGNRVRLAALERIGDGLVGVDFSAGKRELRFAPTACLPGDDQQAELARLTGLGASVPDDQPPGVSWIVMADPEGNEFCLEG